jgi:hypothetical protein
MKNRILKVIFAIGILAMAALACALPSLPGGGNGGNSLYSDDFSDSNGPWGTGTDADSAVEYENGGLRIQVFKDSYYIWSGFSDTNYQDVHIEVTVKNDSSDSTTAFGIVCHQQVTDSAFYYVAMTAEGAYAIAKAAVAQTDVFLTDDDDWATSALITPNADSYRVGADCGRGSIALYVDGRKIDSVSDTTYTKGKIALFAWSSKEKNGSDVTFDDFVVTSLK